MYMYCQILLSGFSPKVGTLEFPSRFSPAPPSFKVYAVLQHVLKIVDQIHVSCTCTYMYTCT